MTIHAAPDAGRDAPRVVPSGVPDGMFPAARLAPARWLGEDGGTPVPSGSPGARIDEWHPGSPFRGAGDIFAPGAEATGAALAIALAEGSPRIGPGRDVPPPCSDERPFLWVQDGKALKMGGRPYLPGLPRDLRHRCVHVKTRNAAEALFALEEGIRCRDLAFVIGEIAGNPREIDFTATRRLVLAAERHGVPLWLVRLDARRDLGAARMRWEAASAPSAPSSWNAQAPGLPRWRAELFRARGTRPGTWWISRQEDGDGHGRIAAAAASDGDLAGAAGDQPLAAAAPER
ncbi:hypothetical protein [Croceicoccus sp. BE223]|uniref:hypothetical protein n=1 Tax=Croceicoccus sp. BE223 TaxID=2817716 RepID=UPI002859891A|nr:hypothetical protein [Croceicoccus sp. BE223]MDR7103116.1 protein ImuA [Croceicoccus sp. BE223]